LVGLILGAFLSRLVRGQTEGRAGAHSAARFVLGIWMGLGTLVFLGCPFRMLQRMGGGDLNAVVGLCGFLLGVGVGRLFESRGYTLGKTSVVLTPAGLPPVVMALIILTLFVLGLMPYGPGPSDVSHR
jgi:YedE family putative selenium metabolism protein